MSPREACRLFRDEMADEEVERALAALRADPDWIVLDPFEHQPEWLLQVVYQPTGRPFGLRAVRAAGRWHFLPPHGQKVWCCDAA